MNNNNKSKDKNEFREEIERIRLSGGGKSLLNHEIVAIFLSIVHGKTQAQAIARRLTDKYSGISKALITLGSQAMPPAAQPVASPVTHAGNRWSSQPLLVHSYGSSRQPSSSFSIFSRTVV